MTLTFAYAPFERLVAPTRQRAALWRLAVGLLLIAITYLGLNALVYGLFALTSGIEAANTMLGKVAIGSTPDSALLLLASFGPMAIGVFLAGRWLHHRRIRQILGPNLIRDTRRSVLIAGAVYAPFILLAMAFMQTDRNLPVTIWAMILPLSVLLIALQTLAEELLFRGYLQVQLAARFARPLIWIVVPAAIFGALHYDPARLGAAAPFAVLAATAFGVAAADLTARTGNLGTAWGLHFINNFAALAILASDGTIIGLGLRVTPYHVSELAQSPYLAAADLIPLGISWFLLRRIAER